MTFKVDPLPSECAFYMETRWALGRSFAIPQRQT
jgi:hypothetical protein